MFSPLLLSLSPAGGRKKISIKKMWEQLNIYQPEMLLRRNLCTQPHCNLAQITFTDQKPTFLFQARPLLNHALDKVEFKHLADPRLMNYVGSEMFRMIEVAAACVQHSAAKRPRMGLVIKFDFKNS